MFKKGLENLKQIRIRKGFTQKTLGEAIGGVDYQTIFRYETGKRDPTGRVVCLLADILKVSTDNLYGRVSIPGDQENCLRNISRCISLMNHNDVDLLLRIAEVLATRNKQQQTACKA